MTPSANPPTRYCYRDLPALLTRMTGDEKHSFAATSTLDVIWTLYDRVLRIDPIRPDAPERDRFLLSKGHGPMAFYAVLAAKGFFDAGLLEGFGRYDSPLGYHPDRMLVPGVEIGSGSLGHGLPIAVGIALALRARGQHDPRVLVLTGDAELDEGSNHEAIAVAGRLGLDNLIAVTVDNRSSSHGWPAGIARRYEVEGWQAVTVDGRDHEALYQALHNTQSDGPTAVIATVEAKS